MRQEFLITLLVAFVMAIGPLNSQAATFCATTSSELQSSLSSAAVNGEEDELRIATGAYSAPVGGFLYNSAGSISGDDESLSISGGWTEFFGNPCGQQLSQNPTLTAINGSGSDPGLRMYLRGEGGVSISLLTFMNGNAPGQLRGGGLYIQPSNPYNAKISVVNNHFIANEAHSSGAMYIYFECGPNAQLVIANNLIVSNHGRGLVGAVEAIVNQPSTSEGARGILTPDPAISFTNNTVVNNTTGSTSNLAVGGVWVNGTVVDKWVVNNNLWGNDGADMRVVSPAGFRLWNNNIESRIGLDPEFVEDNLSAEPEYKDCGILCVHREPILDSPLVDAGWHPYITLPWKLMATDAAGRMRISGPAVDIGAYENHSRLFVDRFEQ